MILMWGCPKVAGWGCQEKTGGLVDQLWKAGEKG